jgi:hypothetical protein
MCAERSTRSHSATPLLYVPLAESPKEQATPIYKPVPFKGAFQDSTQRSFVVSPFVHATSLGSASAIATPVLIRYHTSCDNDWGEGEAGGPRKVA